MRPSSPLTILRKGSSVRRTLPHSHSFAPQTYLQLLESCIEHKKPILGLQIHSRIVISGLHDDSFLLTKLITFYSQCGDLHTAETIFSQIPNCNVFLLNSMIRAYSFNGFHQEAIDVFHQKRNKGIEPDSYTFSCVIKACASLVNYEQGKKLHELAEASGFSSDVFVCNSLICMYSRCGSLANGVRVFDEMPHRDIISWNSIISAFVGHGLDSEAMAKLSCMVRAELKPDQVTVIGILTMCSISKRSAGELHGYVTRHGYGDALMVGNALVSAYGKCGGVEEARRVFDSLVEKGRVSWNAMIASYAQNGLFDESKELLREMKHSGTNVDVVTYSGIISSMSQNGLDSEAMSVFEELLCAGLKPDIVAISTILPAISGVSSSRCCKEIHAYSYRHQLEHDRRVRNALVSVYSKCSLIQDAERVFLAIDNKDVISWSSMVVGFAQNQCFSESLETFRKMIQVKSELNPISITSVLSACAGVSDPRPGKELHLWATKNSFDRHAFIGSALIDMYAKCGRVKDSRRVFDLMEDKNLVTWNSMIGAYAIHGLGDDALKIFRMVKEPDQVSFIAALSACSHGGLVEEGMEIFNSMKDYKMSPKEGHYACMVDLLGRSGKLEQALDLIGTMPVKAGAEVWGVLLGACKTYSNLDLGIYMGSQIIESECRNSGYYVLLSNMFAGYGRWEDVEVVRGLMKEKGVRKGAGCSWIEINNRVHSFVAKERAQHPEWESLFRVLRVLNEQMRGMSF